jgi:hypothetical protein
MLVTKGSDTKGSDAKGPDAKGSDTKGPDARGCDIALKTPFVAKTPSYALSIIFWYCDDLVSKRVVIVVSCVATKEENSSSFLLNKPLI